MKEIWKRIAAIIAANRFTAAISGWGAWFVSSWLFDDILYPAVIAWLGPLLGGGIMASIAITYTYFWTKAIVESERDWFSMKTLHKIQRIVFWVVRIVKNIRFVSASFVDKLEFGLTFFFLNVKFDPMITTLYYRRDETTKVLSEKDLKIFWWSALVSNGYWILISWVFVTMLKKAWTIDWLEIYQSIQWERLLDFTPLPIRIIEYLFS